MSIRFTKMHGAGNDYIYIDATKSCPNNLPELARVMSDRHKGVGSDGLVAIMTSEVADFRMRMFNADGSEGEMCGNASRCIAKFVYDKGLTTSSTITLETLAGIKILQITKFNSDGTVKEVTVDMGKPSFAPHNVPIATTGEMRDSNIRTSMGEMRITALSMGNPHGVIFIDNVANLEINGIGLEIQNLPIFPAKANIEFVEVINRDELRMRVYERGSGETMACGTGACATLVAAVVTNRANRKAVIHLLGGDLIIEWADNDHVMMTGEAVTVFEGEYL
ncbi:MAG: diaminopimelate epimerase [Muribaculaceae bacterium]